MVAAYFVVISDALLIEGIRGLVSFNCFYWLNVRLLLRTDACGASQVLVQHGVPINWLQMTLCGIILNTTLNQSVPSMFDENNLFKNLYLLENKMFFSFFFTKVIFC